MKALFGGATKKPLMTKVSMRHLNEIVRERNQFSRKTDEAWQDFINLKGRLDTEVSKLSKRNNFLIEEAESWKQQLLKVQSMWEQLNREAQDLKVKIEASKRETRRLNALIEQNKADTQRLTSRLQKSEKLREEAIDALMLQQELAETLERERAKNLKEISSLKQTTKTIHRQKEEAQRVVVHLRSLITGQTRHMEHIVGSLYSPSEMADMAEHDDGTPDDGDDRRSATSDRSAGRSSKRLSTARSMASLRRFSRRPTGTMPSSAVAEEASADDSAASPKSKRLGESSLLDIADRHLRDKTDAIANIIRNISEQCSAAVEALQLAHAADQDIDTDVTDEQHRLPIDGPTSGLSEQEGASDDGAASLKGSKRSSTIPPTPDLYRSSTSMSMNSLSTSTERHSGQFSGSAANPRILEQGEESEAGSMVESVSPAAEKGKAPGRVTPLSSQRPRMEA